MLWLTARMRRWLLVLLVMAPGSAWALKPSKHRSLAETYCNAVQLPDAFCRRMGKQVFETDYIEWNDLSAHAQRERGQDRCAAADAALARIDRLGRAAIADAHAARYEAAAIELGGVIHTLQDECAHHGMTNEEHAFYSLEQTCTGDQVSPDVQAEAIACADARTRDAMAIVAAALADLPWTGVEQICRDWDNQDTCAQAALPTPGMACSFLALYHDWDGSDSTWDGAKVGPALLDGFAAAVRGEPATRSACGGDPDAIDPPTPRPATANRDAGCTLTDIVCLGKVDEDGEPQRVPETAGCQTAGAPGLVALLLVIGALSRRRCTSRANRR